jgi:hypothetical protein
VLVPIWVSTSRARVKDAIDGQRKSKDPQRPAVEGTQNAQRGQPVALRLLQSGRRGSRAASPVAGTSGIRITCWRAVQAYCYEAQHFPRATSQSSSAIRQGLRGEVDREITQLAH